VADVVYRPLATALVQAARARGCRVLDGGRMAVFQAADAFRSPWSSKQIRERCADLGLSIDLYDDLDARLAPPRLAELRECSVLYDRDEHGEYLHFYTHILGGRVFFEIVQRIAGYVGYGAVNSPVRMAAHRMSRLRSVR
jgi:4-hydroxyphenylpyruvate dioxygenase